MITIDKLTWDSDFFKLKIGKVSLNNIITLDIHPLNELMKSENYDLLYIIAENYSDKINSHLKNVGATLMDKKVTYQKQITHLNSATSNVFKYSGPLTDELLELVYESGHKSRFKLDPKLNPKFEDMYKTWIENSLSGKLADEVFVTKDNNKLTGFVTVKNSSGTGSIGLIAVSKDFRGKGIGQLLINKVDEWYIQNNISNAEVVTQLDNIGACRFYERNGYKIKNIQYIYHLWKK